MLAGRQRAAHPDLYPYDDAGHPIDQVVLYDQDGNPIDSLCPQPIDRQGRPVRTDYGRDVNGAAVANAFPRLRTIVDPITGRTIIVPAPIFAGPVFASRGAPGTTTSVPAVSGSAAR